MYHCLDCGNELHQLSVTESTDKYWCSKCQKYWFKVRRILVEWVAQPNISK